MAVRCLANDVSKEQRAVSNEQHIKTTFKKSNSLTFGVFNIFNGKKQVNTIHKFKAKRIKAK
jgi:hypothetical protein